MNVSGGGEKVTYYFSTGYYNEEGTTRQTGFDRLNLTMKTNWEIVRNLNFGASVFVGQNTQKSFISDRYSFMNPVKYTRNVNPYLNAYDADGNYVYDPDMAAGTASEYRLDYNYFEEMNNTNYQLKTRSVKTLFDLEYKPLAGLMFYTQFGLQYEDGKEQKDAEKNTYYTRWYNQQTKIGNDYYLPEGGVIENKVADLQQYTWKVQGQYTKRFAQKHEMDLMAGLELRQSTNENIQTKGFGYSSKTLRTIAINFPDSDRGNELANSSLFRPYWKTYGKDRYVSYYMTGSYTYDNRYTFFGSLRYDGTNLFGVDPKYKYTPLWSVSGMWNVGGERFMQDVNAISYLRLRASYGVQGNVDRSTSPYIVGTWQTANVGGVTEDRIDVSTPPNNRLRWETTGMWNAALEFGVLDSRLNFVFEVYGTRSKNLITSIALPQETGFESTMTNFGEITTKGMELSIQSTNIRTKNFTWETSFNIARNTDKIKKIEIDENSWFPSREGHSVNSVFTIPTAGLDEHGVPMFWKDGEKVSMQEFVNFRVTGDGWGGYVAGIDDDATSVRNWYQNQGSRDPKFTGGLTNRFRYKSFDLTIAASFVIKRQVTRTPFYQPASVNPGVNYTEEIFDVWSESNPNGKYPVITGYSKADGSSWGPWEPENYDDLRAWNWMLNSANNVNFWNYLDIWTKEMSYLRVNSIRLGYTLPAEVSRKLRLASVRFSVEARNPFVISTNYDGYLDPETYGNIYTQPMARTVSFGINVSF